MGARKLPALKELSRTHDPSSFTSDYVECTAICEFKSSMKATILAVSIRESMGISANHLSKVFKIDLRIAQRTLKNTTQYFETVLKFVPPS